MDHPIRVPGSVPPGDLAGIAFLQARYYRIGRRSFEPLFLVLHSAECAEGRAAAESLQSYATSLMLGSDGKPREASWHFACDADSVTQSVRLKDTAYHAPPLNDCSIGIEQAGFARQTEGDWSDAFSAQMLRQQVAPLLARLARATAIPLRVLDDAALADTLKTASFLSARKADAEEWMATRLLAGGVVTHVQVSRVFGKSDHYDPGPHYPLDEVLRVASYQLAALGS